MVRPSSRGGVPVFRRVHFKSRVAELVAQPIRGRLAAAAAAVRHLADVRQTVQERAGRRRPRRRRRAPCHPAAQRPAPAVRLRRPRSASSATSACRIRRFRLTLQNLAHSRIRYCFLSHWARGDQTAGPRLVFKSRNWMPTASVTSPITPPRASISLTRWPLAMPPTAGLQDIWAIKSRFIVTMAVLRPMRAHARAASHPAWPAPTTTTS